jgi:hypothetical protein
MITFFSKNILLYVYSYLIINALNHFKLENSNDNTSLTYVGTVFSAIGICGIIIINYISCNLFTLCVPNKMIPWSESSNRPLQIEVLIRTLLTIANTYRSN